MLINCHGPSLVGVVIGVVPHLELCTPITMYGLENCLKMNSLIGPHVSKFLVYNFVVEYLYDAMSFLIPGVVVWKGTSSGGQM